MTEIIKPIGLLVVGYALGAIPTGYWVAKLLKGIDIRQFGSGNPGAGNVYRIVGAKGGILTLAIDSFKGYVPVTMAQMAYPDMTWLIAATGGLAITGHLWTVFLSFKGGKGVATAAGVFAALMPEPVLVALAVFCAGVLVSRHISVGSTLGAGAFPMIGFLFHAPAPYTVLSCAVTALILWKHVPNIKRLLSGSELKI